MEEHSGGLAVCRNGELPPICTIGQLLWRIQGDRVDTMAKKNKNSYHPIMKHEPAGYNFRENKKGKMLLKCVTQAVRYRLATIYFADFCRGRYLQKSIYWGGCCTAGHI